MKRLTTLLLLLCCLPFMAMAQDLNPGQQSQGLLESRNVTVDYSTGIFHYQIPLYTLKSGDYELPISLRYSGKGVKVSDNPGLVGYNWTLDTGGVVTRIVRGGIPDEDYNYGYLKFENDPTPLSEDATRVNRHKRDGECDIFTAVFGGKSVNFIIRKDGNGDLYAEPLERTDVKIECKGSRSFISGWIVTDNDGTRYNYMRTEWTCNLDMVDQISFNGISKAQYPSSWHLTKIEPVNGKAIEFKYLGTETHSPTTYLRRVINHYETYHTKYEYGRPMEMPVYDFEAYREDFEMYFNSAMAEVQDYDIQLQMQTQEMYLYFDTIDGWLRHPDYDFIAEDMKMNRRVLGMGDFSQVSAVSEELLGTLLGISEYYRTIDYSISSKFQTAYHILLDCVNGVIKEIVTERTVNGGVKYRIVSPILESITCDETVFFKYDADYNRLYEIKKETLNGNAISAYSLSYSNYNLDSVTSLGEDSVPFDTVTMNYHALPSETRIMADVFGFMKPYSDDPDAPFEPSLDGEYAKAKSLKEIRFADGGKVCLDYELNGLPNAVDGIPYGGIRIKSVVLDNPSEARCDTITYLYDQAFFTFWEFPDNYEEAVYSNFTDKVWHSRVKTTGHATLSPGNNGLYYPMVRENISGQGTRWLYFNFTDYGRDWSHSHWLVGLPALTVEQNEEGNVERVIQNLYYTDIESGLAPCLFPENLIHLDAASYDMALPQMTVNETYMDLEDTKQEMNIGPGESMRTSHERAFWMNIAPRIRSEYRNDSYSLYYGGATVLAEQREYRPKAGEYTDTWSLMEEEPYSRTVYHYDNLQEHTRPTRIVNYDANGDSTIVYQVYVGDMETTVNEAIAAMQEANILSPMVKRAIVKNGELQEEEVTVYGTVDKEDGCFYAPEKVLVRKGGNGSYVPNTSSLYSGSVADYQERKEMTSAVIGGDSYLPVGMTEQGTHTAYAYDPNSKWCILQATDTPADKVIAVEGWHYKQYAHPMERILSLATKLQEGIEGYDPESILLDNYQEFRATQFYERGKKLLELLAKEAEPIGLSELLDSCAIDFYIGIGDYIAWQIELEYNYFPAVSFPSPWDMSYEDIYELLVSLMDELQENNGANLLNYLQTYREREDFMPQTLAVLAGQADYTLHLVPMEANAVVTYTITHNGGTTERTLELSGLTPGKVKEVSLDLNAYSGASGITVTGFGNVQYLVVAPEGTEFEATAYNEDDAISLKFDPSGHMELYEYDKAGRLVLVRDENGKILKGNEYNKKSTNL